MIPRLSMNLDYIATLRQKREEVYPSLVEAASVMLNNGANQITMHLREDRRHIQDTDVETIHLVTKRFGRPLRLEIGLNLEIIEVALAAHPEWICLVPEKNEERTIGHGLDLKNDELFMRTEAAIQKMRESLPEVKIAILLEANLEYMVKAKDLKIDAIEVHTGEFAKTFLNGDDVESFLKNFRDCHEFLKSINKDFVAGHGLSSESLVPLLSEKIFSEYSIGHWAICDALFNGLPTTVKNLKVLMESHPLK